MNGARAALGALMEELGDSQWASAEQIATTQFEQLDKLAKHCGQQSPHFARRLADAGLKPSDLRDPRSFARLPVLTRRDLQAAGEDLYCRRVPEAHGPVGEGKTSGSTGEPVVVLRTGLTRLIFLAMTMRDLLWHAVDVEGKGSAVRAGVSAPEVDADWGPPASLFGTTGPFLSIPVNSDVARLVSWIEDFGARSLLIYPSTLRAFVTYCADRAISLPALRQLRTVGETLSPSVREDAAAFFGARVTDCYSSQELGYMALQCPVSGMYHPMAEGVIAEVLDGSGRACVEGELGRITLTDLHNFATPLVRYEIGDVAEVGAPCPCGRGFPTWRRIVGRERNLLLMPDGTRHWPITGFNRCRDVAPILQYQLVQTGRETIEARLVVERTLTVVEQDNLRELFHSCVGHPFALELTYLGGRIPHGSNGKFEEFICAVADR